MCGEANYKDGGGNSCVSLCMWVQPSGRFDALWPPPGQIAPAIAITQDIRPLVSPKGWADAGVGIGIGWGGGDSLNWQ